MFITLLESAFPNNLGFDITSDAEVRLDAFLFGESQSRIVVSVSQDKETDFIDFMIANNYTFNTLGHITKGEIRVDDVSYGNILTLKEKYNTVLESHLEK